MSTDMMGWNGPGSADSNGIRQLLAKIARIEQRLADMERGAPLRAAGIGVDENGMTVGSSLGVTGDLNVSGVATLSGDTTISGDLGVSGAATISGGATLTGTLVIEGTPDQVATIEVRDRGRIRSLHPDGSTAAVFGPLYDEITGLTSYGLLVQDEAGEDVIYARAGDDGDRHVTITSDTRLWLQSRDAFTLRTLNDSHRIQVVGNDLGVDAPGRFFVAANLHATGNLSCGGTKPFIIDHPLHADKSLVHVATETPIASIEYPWPEPVTLDENGEAELTLPDYFEALAADDYRAVWVQPVGRPFATGADLVADGRTTVYGEPGRQVFVKVSARRGDAAGQFEVEIPRIQPPAEEVAR